MGGGEGGKGGGNKADVFFPHCSLICTVTYSSSSSVEEFFMRKFYKFGVAKPLDVKTKFSTMEVCKTSSTPAFFFYSPTCFSFSSFPWTHLPPFLPSCFFLPFFSFLFP